MTDFYDLLSRCIGFDWDKWNTDKNWVKHNVTSLECEDSFFNQPFIAANDEKHSQNEKRFYALGRTNAYRLLFIVFTIRGHWIRIISARNMSIKEREEYRNHEK